MDKIKTRDRGKGYELVNNTNPKSPLSGSNDEFTNVLHNQTLQTLYSTGAIDNERNKQLLAMSAVMTSINPQDEIESMIAAQVVATHNAIMKCFADALTEDNMFSLDDRTNYKYSPEVRNMFMQTAGKLTKTYTSLLDSLNRHRGKYTTEQKITVQYVNINDGGQAIIGNVKGSAKKK